MSAGNDPGRSLDSISRRRGVLPLGDRSAALILDAVQRRGERRRIAWGYWIDGRIGSRPWQAKLLQAKVRLFGGPDTTGLVVFSTRIEADRAVARARLARFTGAWDISAWLRLASGEQRVN